MKTIRIYDRTGTLVAMGDYSSRSDDELGRGIFAGGEPIYEFTFSQIEQAILTGETSGWVKAGGKRFRWELGD